MHSHVLVYFPRVRWTMQNGKCRHENDQHPNDAASGPQHIAAGLVLLAELVGLAVALRPPCGRHHHFVRVHRHLALGDGHRALFVLAARPDQMVTVGTDAARRIGTSTNIQATPC